MNTCDWPYIMIAFSSLLTTVELVTCFELAFTSWDSMVTEAKIAVQGRNERYTTVGGWNLGC